jgi:hypothetical protein
MRKLLAALVAVLFSASAFAAGLPLLPSTSQYSEASQIVGTINALIQQLNGQQGYAPATPVIGVGAFCSGSAASGAAVTCAGQRGTAAWTAMTIGANGTSTQTITDTSIAANSVCTGGLITATGGAGSTPFVSSMTPTAGSLSVIFGNGSATSTGSVTITMGFNCVN